jgi:hypothetical protein
MGSIDQNKVVAEARQYAPQFVLALLNSRHVFRRTSFPTLANLPQLVLEVNNEAVRTATPDRADGDLPIIFMFLALGGSMSSSSSLEVTRDRLAVIHLSAVEQLVDNCQLLVLSFLVDPGRMPWWALESSSPSSASPTTR